MNLVKTYKLATNSPELHGLVRFGHDEIQSISLTPDLGFQVVLTSGRAHQLDIKYYSELQRVLGRADSAAWEV